MEKKILMTAFSKDRPGIVADVTLDAKCIS
jgi:hypothetical protein